ncbi:hypothetical protein GCM10020358_72950 [Amorphoplanes nipponensis]|uniref:DUF4192 domain-containing protein n=1 Tax=Actinoplanes nipponensis TaxID=135950 RepID=A0A919MPP0_9ACTN|nr:DUF4192 domain-containing protein [Actinoplanes nipponensis]GIE49713.1 hypothetical protein Ani05nite_32470 [Actinoplanes nipponensis]
MTTLKVTSPAELISAVPFLIGFHPADSLTVVAMRGPLITFAVRIDLPEDGTPEEEAHAAVLHLATVVLRQQVEAVTILGYGTESRVTPAVLRISKAFRKEGLTIVDELRVTDGRYWSYLCTETRCCPAEGRPCEPANSVLAAEATFAGAVALPDRETLSAQLAPVTGDDREAMTSATAKAVLRLAALASERPALPGARIGPAPGYERSGDAPRFHDSKTPEPLAAASAAGRPGTAELHLGGVLWAKLGLAVPLPPDRKPTADPDPATGPVPGPGARPDLNAEPDLGTQPNPDPDMRPEAQLAPDLLSDEDYFFTLVRNAGRLAVREAERCYSSGGRLPDDDVAWLGVLLLNVPVRDYAWTRTRTEEWELALWSDVMRRVESRYLPAPAGLLAFVAWRMGQGALASVAVERALTEKPDYSLGLLMQRVLTVGLPPSVVDGWPAVEGMPTSEHGVHGEDDDARESHEPDRIGHADRPRVQIRPEIAKPGDTSRERRDRAGERRQAPRRATHRGI